jgi:quinoprotein glucose dehydrogenase
MKSTLTCWAVGLLLLCNCVPAGRRKDTSRPPSQKEDWPAYGGNKAGNRYSPLTQINTGNVALLQPAWSYDTGENKDPAAKGIDLQCQPIVINGILYGTTPKMKLFALQAATGKQIWKFDPFADPTKKPRYHAIRGVAYWEAGDDKRILYAAGPFLYAIDALTGKKIEAFGSHGEVDLHEGLGDRQTLGHDVRNLSVDMTSPGAIYKDLLIIGSRVSEYGDAAPGYIRAFQVRSGKLAWVFHTIPRPGEYGYETWPTNAYKHLGGANAWSGLVVDEKRGIVYTGTGSAAVDFYGGARSGQNLFANSVLALNAETGQRIWHFQTQHHDLWDRDLPCPPNLTTLTHRGRRVDAVVQATKDGLIFVFDRDTGAPLFPVQEVPVPTAPALPGEHPWPTQPIPTKPAPFARQQLSEADITDRTPEAHAYVRRRYLESRSGSKYMPPSLVGSLFYGFGGGAEWGGNAIDRQGVLYQNSNEMLWWLKMSDRRKPSAEPASRGQALFQASCAGCHGVDGKGSGGGDQAQAYPVLTGVGKRLTRAQISATISTGRGRMPSFQHIPAPDREAIVNFLLHTEPKPAAPATAATDFHTAMPAANPGPDTAFPYVPPFLNNGYTQFRDPDLYPAIKPPWGTLNAIDLNTGEYLWKVPLGEYPALTKQGLPPTGTENHGGPIVTAGGLIFIAATYDEKIRAFDRKTGKIVWEYQLPAGGFATPVTYMVNSRQYLVIAAGGTRYGLKPGGSYVAFALP